MVDELLKKMTNFRVILFVFLVKSACGWKPVVGPTASYTRLTHHHPAGHNTLGESDGTGEHTVTYHGNAFGDHSVIKHPTLLDEDKLDDTDGRVLTGHTGFESVFGVSVSYCDFSRSSSLSRQSQAHCPTVMLSHPSTTVSCVLSKFPPNFR